MRTITLGSFVLLVLALALPAPAAAQTTPAPGWYDGLIQYSSITNCVSIIQGFPYQEYGVGTYVGFYGDPNNALPAPNTTYYVHVVIYGLGNSCSGMRAFVDVALPANTSLAITAATPVRCYADGSRPGRTSARSRCRRRPTMPGPTPSTPTTRRTPTSGRSRRDTTGSSRSPSDRARR